MATLRCGVSAVRPAPSVILIVYCTFVIITIARSRRNTFRIELSQLDGDHTLAKGTRSGTQPALVARGQQVEHHPRQR